MRIRTVTAALMITGIVLLVSWPWLIGPRPPRGAPRIELRDYLYKMSAYVFVLLVILIVTAFCAYLIVRQQRKEYEVAVRENLKQLIEATLEDHSKKDKEKPQEGHAGEEPSA